MWNPSNSTPRRPAQRIDKQRNNREAESLEIASVPLEHPDLLLPRESAEAGGEYPLLSLPEQRQKRHSGSTRASIQLERSGSDSGIHRVSLPLGVKKNSREGSPIQDKGKGRAIDEGPTKEKKTTGLRKRGQSVPRTALATTGLSFDKGKGKGKEIMSTDIERGPATQSEYVSGGTSNLPRPESRASLQSGIGAALSSSGTSIVGSDGPANDPAEEWGPQHPCFPHMNSHVPLSSPLYQTTRIIRIRRDWYIAGDLAPTFSNLYPEILDPAGVSEADFRTLVERVNNELIPAFNPWGLRNIVDGILGLLTGWVWDDLGFTGVKSRLRRVERFLEEWNAEMEERSKDSGSAARIVPLRRTGYMNVRFAPPQPLI